MEGLVIILGGFLANALISAGVVVWGGGGGVLALSVGSAAQRKVIAWLGGMAAAIAVLIAGAVVVLDSWYFEPTVRFLADRVGSRADVDIRFKSVEGSLLDGRLSFTGFEARRTGHEERDFTFATDAATVEVDLVSLAPFLTPTFKKVHLDTVRGHLVEHAAAADAKEGSASAGGTDFAVDDFRIERLSVTVEKPGGRELKFDMPLIEARPLRSQFALFDVMFRSNVRGAVNGHPVRISTGDDSGRRTTEWDIDAMPVSIVAAFVNQAPFTWFEAGTADIEVRDEWRVGEITDIDMDWRFAFEGVRTDVPEGAGLTERILASATRKFFESRGDSVEISFRLVVNKDEFRGLASGDAVDFFAAAVDAMTAAMAENLGMSQDEAGKGVEDVTGAARDYLDRRRKQE